MVTLEETEQKILQELRKAETGYTRRKICEVSDFTRNTVSKHLKSLQERDLVIEQKQGGIYLYHAKENLPADYGEEKDE
jgi:predicted transcriptional regulator